MPQIKEMLQLNNPWWEESFSFQYKERAIYTKIEKFLFVPQIISFTGLRRVGKTTLMLRIVQEYITKEIPQKNIIYFSFDNFKQIELLQILAEYQRLMQKEFRKEKFLLLLDEIQKLDNWQEQLKTVYDLYSKNVKIIITGSESLFIKRRIKESLAGRIFEFKVEPLTFEEFLVFKGINYPVIPIYEKQFSTLFKEYMQTMGFPELVNIIDKEFINKYISEGIIEKVIYSDLQQIFGLKETASLQSLMNILMNNPGEIMELNDIAKELKISRQTVANYISYLEDSFLLRKLYNYSGNRRKIERKLKKYYPTLISPEMLFKEEDYMQSKIFEWFVINQLKAEFFWRDPYKKEVDAVLANEKIIPIEIKYGKIEINNLLSFMTKFNCKQGYIISKEKKDTIKEDNKRIEIIPAYLFFLKEIKALKI
ncbi:ATP-binding protein [Candidatus Woesearchaeota archaeon]|nr:ATP-binding protein [Candidatus Woesearchaeota archaeon]